MHRRSLSTNTTVLSQQQQYTGDTIDRNVYNNNEPFKIEQNNATHSKPSHKRYNSVLDNEIHKFSAMSSDWWNVNGSVKPLHSMNPVRIKYIKDMIIKEYKNIINHNPTHTPLAGLSILDVGCGGGLLCEALARLGCTHVHGIDATLSSINIAKKHIENQSDIKDNIVYECITAEELVEQDKQYDIVCGLELVEHVNDQSQFINTLKQLVKPNNGLLFISTLNKTQLSYWLAVVGAEYIMRLVAQGTHDWNMFIKPEQLIQYIKAPVVHDNNNSSDNNNTTQQQQQQFTVEDIHGMIYNPLTNNWWLDKKNQQINYILYAKSTLVNNNNESNQHDTIKS